MIFISYNQDGYITSVVSAKSKELANAFWQGKRVNVFTSKCLEDEYDFTPLNEHVSGVIEIVKTREKDLDPMNFNSKKIVLIDK